MLKFITASIALFFLVVAFEAQSPTPPPAVGQPIPVQPDIPRPDPITAESVNRSMTDVLLSRDNCNQYAAKLQAKIVELWTENQKLKDELAKTKPATPTPPETK